MTLEQFDNQRFGAGMKANYEGKIYAIAGVDFHERLISIEEFPDEENDIDKISWERCENITIVE